MWLLVVSYTTSSNSTDASSRMSTSMKNHGAENLVEPMFETGRQTLALPMDEKMKYWQGNQGDSFGCVSPTRLTIHLVRRIAIIEPPFLMLHTYPTDTKQQAPPSLTLTAIRTSQSSSTSLKTMLSPIPLSSIAPTHRLFKRTWSLQYGLSSSNAWTSARRSYGCLRRSWT